LIACIPSFCETKNQSLDFSRRWKATIDDIHQTMLAFNAFFCTLLVKYNVIHPMKNISYIIVFLAIVACQGQEEIDAEIKGEIVTIRIDSENGFVHEIDSFNIKLDQPMFALKIVNNGSEFAVGHSQLAPALEFFKVYRVNNSELERENVEFLGDPFPESLLWPQNFILIEEGTNYFLVTAWTKDPMNNPLPVGEYLIENSDILSLGDKNIKVKTLHDFILYSK
jgi:hypothetical protein